MYIIFLVHQQSTGSIEIYSQLCGIITSLKSDGQKVVPDPVQFPNVLTPCDINLSPQEPAYAESKKSSLPGMRREGVKSSRWG